MLLNTLMTIDQAIDQSEYLLVRPTRPSDKAIGLLERLKEYDSFSKVPKALLDSVFGMLNENQVLAVWMLRVISDRRLTYSIEEKDAAIKTYKLHVQDVIRHNPVLVKYFDKWDYLRL